MKRVFTEKLNDIQAQFAPDEADMRLTRLAFFAGATVAMGIAARLLGGSMDGLDAFVDATAEIDEFIADELGRKTRLAVN